MPKHFVGNSGSLGKQTIDGTTTTYEKRFNHAKGENLSVHVTWTNATTLTAAFTLWASNKPNPDATVDGDWIQMVAAHGFDGLPNGDPAAAGDGGDLTDIGNANAQWYRVKMVRSAGSADIEVFYSKKDEK